MSWVYLITAGLFECFWSTMMKLSEGFSRPGCAAATVVGMIVSFWALILATKELPISLAYPIWTGIGAAGTVLIGIFIFGEPATFWRLFFITTLVASIVGLKLV